MSTPVYSYTRTELLYLRTKTSLLSLSTVDRLNDLNIGYHLPCRHHSSRGVKRKKENLHSFIVDSFNNIIIIMVIFKCYFSGELIALSYIKNIYKKQQQRCEHRIRKNKQIKSTVYDANKK